MLPLLLQPGNCVAAQYAGPRGRSVTMENWMVGSSVLVFEPGSWYDGYTSTRRRKGSVSCTLIMGYGCQYKWTSSYLCWTLRYRLLLTIPQFRNFRPKLWGNIAWTSNKMRLQLISYTSLTILGELTTDQTIKLSWPRFQPQSSPLRAEKVEKEEEAADRNQIKSPGSTVSSWVSPSQSYSLSAPSSFVSFDSVV